jgi:small subunit ribosomal protein S2
VIYHKEEQLAVVTMKNLLESGVHFGHQTKRWDPRMKRFIFAERNGIHIIDLQKTILSIKEAYEAVRKTVLANKSVLFVGTKKQAQAAIEREAKRCGMFYVNNRWLGGMLTNFFTIQKSILRLKKIEKMEVDGTFDNMTKKEVALLNKERSRLDKNLGGIKEMKDLPGILFIIDTRKESIAVEEAKKMNIPIVAVVDTNCNPDGINYPIPGNDDAIRAITLFTQIIANAVVEAENEAGLEVIETLQEDEEKEEPEKEAEDFESLLEKDKFEYIDKDDEEDQEEKKIPGKGKKPSKAKATPKGSDKTKETLSEAAPAETAEKAVKAKSASEPAAKAVEDKGIPEPAAEAVEAEAAPEKTLAEEESPPAAKPAQEEAAAEPPSSPEQNAGEPGAEPTVEIPAEEAEETTSKKKES